MYRNIIYSATGLPVSVADLEMNIKLGAEVDHWLLKPAL